jgi:hypothetical protein
MIQSQIQDLEVYRGQDLDLTPHYKYFSIDLLVLTFVEHIVSKMCHLSLLFEVSAWDPRFWPWIESWIWFSVFHIEADVSHSTTWAKIGAEMELKIQAKISWSCWVHLSNSGLEICCSFATVLNWAGGDRVPSMNPTRPCPLRTGKTWYFHRRIFFDSTSCESD